jgi:peroxiredoxin
MSEPTTVEDALTQVFRQADALQAPLPERLDFYLGRLRKLLPELEATYDDLVARIRESGAGTLVPAVGHKMPSFLLADSEGHLVGLESYLKRGPLVISFNRGPWCDYCGLELHALARAYPYIAAAGADVVSVTPELGQYACDLQAKHNLPFTVLTDVDLMYAFSLGLVFWVGDKIKDMYRQFGIDLEQFQGNGGWLLPIPATLIVGQDGHVKARFVDPDFRHRMKTEDILAAVSDDLR